MRHKFEILKLSDEYIAALDSLDNAINNYRNQNKMIEYVYFGIIPLTNKLILSIGIKSPFYYKKGIIYNRKMKAKKLFKSIPMDKKILQILLLLESKNAFDCGILKQFEQCKGLSFKKSNIQRTI